MPTINPNIVYNDPEFDKVHYPVTDFMVRSLITFCEIMNIKGEEPKFYYFATIHGVIFIYDEPKPGLRLDPTTMLELVNKIENLRYVEVDATGKLNLALDH